MQAERAQIQGEVGKPNSQNRSIPGLGARRLCERPSLPVSSGFASVVPVPGRPGVGGPCWLSAPPPRSMPTHVPPGLLASPS